MLDRLMAVAVVFDVAVVLLACVAVVQRRCLRKLRDHRRSAEWYAGAASGCQRLAIVHASRARRARGERTRAFYRMRSQSLPREAARHLVVAKSSNRAARFWEFLS
jgi:hypothetical protein